jgi:predicted nucleic acid-binding protein
MIAVADTNAVIAYARADHEHHEAAVASIDGYEIIYIHPLNLAEVLAGIPDDGRRHETQRTLTEVFIPYPGHADEPDLAAHIYDLATVRVKHGAKMPDTCALYAAMRAKAPLITFDKRLRSIALAAHIDVLPVS